MTDGLPGFTHVDHVGLTVPNLDDAIAFYTGVIGGTELYRLGPFGPDDRPPLPDGRDWSDAHLNVALGEDLRELLDEPTVLGAIPPARPSRWGSAEELVPLP